MIIRPLFALLLALAAVCLVPFQGHTEESLSELKIGSIEDLLTPRRPLPLSLLAVNAFGNDSRFGSIASQYREVRSNLNLREVRLLFAWNDQVQPTPTSTPFFGFYDEVSRSLPAGVSAMVVLTGIPSWMRDPKNWIDGNPRTTFVERWVKPVVLRYRTNAQLSAYQIWNEPNNPGNPHNTTLGILSDPTQFVELVATAHATIRSQGISVRVVNGATTAIAQNFPRTLSYNRALVSAGILNFVDAYAIHYYGKNIERVLQPNGVASFLRSVSKPLWVTEIGERGTTKQLEYMQRIIPFLQKNAPGIQRFFIYQFTEATPASSTYGLKNLTPGRFLSDLYIFLRSNRRGARRASRHTIATLSLQK